MKHETSPRRPPHHVYAVTKREGDDKGHWGGGTVSLSERATVRGRIGLRIERDLHFTAEKPISAYIAEASKNSRIIA